LRTGRGRGSTRASESSSSSSRAFCSAIVLIRPPMVRCLGGSRGRTVRAERAHGHSGQRPRPGARRAAPRAADGGTRPWRPASGCPTLAAELPRRRCAAGHPASMVGCLNAFGRVDLTGCRQTRALPGAIKKKPARCRQTWRSIGWPALSAYPPLGPEASNAPPWPGAHPAPGSARHSARRDARCGTSP
jgi:hypothetical protein